MALCENAVSILDENNSGAAGLDATKTSITKLVAQIKRFQERIRKHIEDNYVELIPNHSSSDLYLDESEKLVSESEYLLQTVGRESPEALCEANGEITGYVQELSEISLGLRLSYRILKVDDLFQCVEEANTTKEYLIVLDLLGKLKSLIYNEGGDDVDCAFLRCTCYDAIKVKYHIQSDVLKQNLQQRFDRLVQLNEKPFPNAKCVTLQISKDVNQLQDTVMALFQARYNPIKMCDFLLVNCLEPLVLKPVSVEYTDESPEHVQLTLSYSLKDLNSSLRPSYKNVFEHIQVLFQCLGHINVSVTNEQHVFSIIGDHIKQSFLTLLVDQCLMHAIPETMDELQESTLVEDVLQFEQSLADSFFINVDTDRALTEFTEKFDSYFRIRFCKKVLDSARDIMQKDLQDMTLIAEKNSPEDVAKNPFLFPRCMVSKSTLELVKLMERVQHQSNGQGASGDGKDTPNGVIATILNCYVVEVPKVHEKLLESIPQQAALFYNDCMFLGHWVAKNSDQDIPTFPALVKTLQATGRKYFGVQVAYQQKILIGILKEFDISDAHSLGSAPFKLVRQCLRQLELLMNVWQSVLPDRKYNETFCDLLNDFSHDLVRRICALEDISATVAEELSGLIDIVLAKGPALFKAPHEVVHVQSWQKLQHLRSILNATLQEVVEQWCGGAGILTAHFKAEELRHLVRALFQNTDRRAKALNRII